MEICSLIKKRKKKICVSLKVKCFDLSGSDDSRKRREETFFVEECLRRDVSDVFKTFNSTSFFLKPSTNICFHTMSHENVCQEGKY